MMPRNVPLCAHGNEVGGLCPICVPNPLEPERSPLIEVLEIAAERDLQMLGAGLSKRSWHEVETAYNQLRDRIDAFLARSRAATRDAARTANETGSVE